jgi:hypothetical protein
VARSRVAAWIAEPAATLALGCSELNWDVRADAAAASGALQPSAAPGCPGGQACVPDQMPAFRSGPLAPAGLGARRMVALDDGDEYDEMCQWPVLSDDFVRGPPSPEVRVSV